MALNIKNEGSLTEAVTVAVRERLESLQRKHRRREVAQAVPEIEALVERIPNRDIRSAQDIIRYDDHGLPASRSSIPRQSWRLSFRSLSP